MPRIHVCSLNRLPQVVRESGASHIVTLINDETAVMRPDTVIAERHLFLGMNDIIEAMEGMVLPGEAHVSRLLEFCEAWEREQPMVVHCWAGISRSTAGAFIATCALKPEADEEETALALRAASATATPNAKLVAIADALLGRNGRMVRAVAKIGRGAFAAEGEPFHIEIGPRQR